MQHTKPWIAAAFALAAAAQLLATAQTITPIPRQAKSAAQLLAYFDVDDRLLRQFVDRRPLHDDERDALAQILFALPKLPPDEVAHWIKHQPDWQTLSDAPQDHRTEMFRLAGRVTRVEQVELTPELAERFEYSHYYMADVKLGADELPVVVCARKIPQAWKIGAPLDEAVSFDAMFLKFGDKPVFAATRLAWRPSKLNAAAGVGPDQVFLGELGMDVGLWDDVVDKSEFAAGDREAFYQLLAAMGRAQPATLAEKSTAVFHLVDLLRTPEQFHGRLLTIEGTARRAAKIIVSDADIRERYRIDHYYEVYVIVQLPKPLVLKHGEEQLEFNSYPVTCCVRELPPGMDEGDRVRENIRVRGAFFKLWRYESPQMTEFDPHQLQPSPLLVGLAPELLPPPAAPNEYLGVIIGSLFVVALIGAWLYVWRMSRGDARFKRETLNRNYELAAGQSLNRLDIEAKGSSELSRRDSQTPLPEKEITP